MYPVYEYLAVLIALGALSVLLFATSAVILVAQEGAKFISRSTRARVAKTSGSPANHRPEILGIRSIIRDAKP